MLNNIKMTFFYSNRHKSTRREGRNNAHKRTGRKRRNDLHKIGKRSNKLKEEKSK
jgi:hypothetical protein